MKQNMRKIFGTILLIVLLSCMSVISYADLDYSITSGISSIEVGKTYNITIKATGITGKFNISSSSNVSTNCSSVWVENGVASTQITVTTNAEGEATVTFTPESIASAETGDLITNLSSKTDRVTVKSTATKPTQTTPESKPTQTKPTITTPTFTSKNETVYATGDGVNVRSSCTTSVSNNILGSLSKGESLKRTGIATKAIDGITWSKVTYNGKTAYVTSAYLSTTKPVVNTDKEDDEKDEKDETTTKKSNNKKLSSLKVTGSELTPEFSASTTEYTMTIGSDIDKLQIEAVAEDEKAKVAITGNKNLKVGENTISIKVTAEDKTVKTYKIIVTKEKEEQIRLEELLIEGVTLEPEFNSNTYEYEVTIENKDTKELNITATPSKEKAKIEIVGNKDLKVGENTITIIVKSSDGKETATYQIKANIKEAKPVATTNNNSSDLYKYIAIGVVLAIICIAGIIILSKHKKNDDIDDEAFDEDDSTEKVLENDSKSEEKNIVDELPKLDNEDLPKYLRNKSIENDEQEKSERSKKIDEFYANSSSNSTGTKRGKHF